MNDSEHIIDLNSPFMTAGLATGCLSYFWLWPFFIIGCTLSCSIGLVLGWIHLSGFKASLDPIHAHDRKRFYLVRLATFLTSFVVAFGIYTLLYALMSPINNPLAAALPAGCMTIILTLYGIIGPYRWSRRDKKKKKDVSSDPTGLLIYESGSHGE